MNLFTSQEGHQVIMYKRYFKMLTVREIIEDRRGIKVSQLKDLTRGNRIIISVMGPDKVGIINGVTNVMSSNNINILDISQTILEEYLVMVLICDMEGSRVDLARLKEELNSKGRELGVRIDAQHEDVFNYMHRI